MTTKYEKFPLSKLGALKTGVTYVKPPKAVVPAMKGVSMQTAFAGHAGNQTKHADGKKVQLKFTEEESFGDISAEELSEGVVKMWGPTGKFKPLDLPQFARNKKTAQVLADYTDYDTSTVAQVKLTFTKAAKYKDVQAAIDASDADINLEETTVAEVVAGTKKVRNALIKAGFDAFADYSVLENTEPFQIVVFSESQREVAVAESFAYPRGEFVKPGKGVERMMAGDLGGNKTVMPDGKKMSLAFSNGFRGAMGSGGSSENVKSEFMGAYKAGKTAGDKYVKSLGGRDKIPVAKKSKMAHTTAYGYKPNQDFERLVKAGMHPAWEAAKGNFVKEDVAFYDIQDYITEMTSIFATEAKQFKQLKLSDLVDEIGGKEAAKKKFKNADAAMDALYKAQDDLMKKYHKDFEEVADVDPSKIADWADSNFLSEAKLPKDKDVPIEVQGLKGMKSTQWSKKFKNQAEMEKWMEKHGDDITVQRYSTDRVFEDADFEELDEAKNHMGETEYNSWSAWRAACKKANPAYEIEGDKDIAQALVDGKAIGEWGGETGTVFDDAHKQKKIKEDVDLNNRLRQLAGVPLLEAVDVENIPSGSKVVYKNEMGYQSRGVISSKGKSRSGMITYELENGDIAGPEKIISVDGKKITEAQNGAQFLGASSDDMKKILKQLKDDGFGDVVSKQEHSSYFLSSDDAATMKAIKKISNDRRNVKSEYTKSGAQKSNDSNKWPGEVTVKNKDGVAKHLIGMDSKLRGVRTFKEDLDRARHLAGLAPLVETNHSTKENEMKISELSEATAAPARKVTEREVHKALNGAEKELEYEARYKFVDVSESDKAVYWYTQETNTDEGKEAAKVLAKILRKADIRGWTVHVTVRDEMRGSHKETKWQGKSKS